MIIIKTSMGDIKAELFDEKAPETVKNFLGYVDNKHFDGTIFHRVIPGFMIQGGGFTYDFKQKPTRTPVVNEAGNGLKNQRGTLAMARTSDINSATAQFFINLIDNSFLDHRDKTNQGFGYCVFGKVTEGMEVVDRIAGVSTGVRGHHENVPTTNVVIHSIEPAV
ncbi:MAG: peptidylprolyl isomerase [Kiritimatiellae bacterium]|nr:peptidylprolyl isomerase [Kiritimatiellia bacterium]MDD5521836.1 peptidylprolyl isomerase [Kiritimatiellia bacterium]